MIREPAAKALAESLFGAYLKAGYCTPAMVEQAACLIRVAVSNDETQQHIEKLQAELTQREAATA